MLALFVNIKINRPLGISSFDSSFKYGVSADTKYTNKTNYAMNQENNQTQIDLWNQQKEYDYQMWKENNEYNSPTQQVQRLQDAGINPALALSNISTGTTSSTAGGQTPPQTTPGHNEPGYPEMISKVQNLALIGKQLSDISKQFAETESIQKQNFWTDAQNAVNLAKSNSEVGRNLADTVGKNLENKFQREVFDERVSQYNQMGEKLMYETLKEKASASLTEWMSKHQQYVYEKLDPQELQNLKAAYSEAFASIAEKYSNVAVNKANIKKIGAEVNNLVKQNDIFDKTSQKLGQELYINDETAGAVIQEIRARSAGTTWENSGIGKAIDMLFRIGGMLK